VAPEVEAEPATLADRRHGTLQFEPQPWMHLYHVHGKSVKSISRANVALRAVTELSDAVYQKNQDWLN
jgi:hypothetical protein